MANNYRKTGDVLTFTAPAGGVVAGRVYIIGTLPVVALVTAAVGARFEGRVTGEWALTKIGSQAWTEGQKIQWDTANQRCTNATTAAANLWPIGVATAAVGSGAGDTTGWVRLNGVASTLL